MNYMKETLWERFFNRLPEKQANDAIRILKQGGTYRDIDFFDLKEVEQQVNRYRERARAAIAAYKRWKAGAAIKNLFSSFQDREGAALRAHARTMAGMYLDTRRDHAELTGLLMKSVSSDAPDQGTPPKGDRHAR